LCFLLGIKHGVGNCIVFEHIDEYYPKGVAMYKQMRDKHQIDIPKGVCADLTDEQFDIMIDVALSLEPLWENAIGKDWKQTITREVLRALYEKM
jgi:3-deoxy-alpha-D-manno-octulosonate 8-oxidase